MTRQEVAESVKKNFWYNTLISRASVSSYPDTTVKKLGTLEVAIPVLECSHDFKSSSSCWVEILLPEAAFGGTLCTNTMIPRGSVKKFNLDMTVRRFPPKLVDSFRKVESSGF